METPVPNPSRLKRFSRGALFVLAALVTLGAAFIAEEDWRGSLAWRHYKSGMEARGDSIDSARLIPPKVPDNENFAACPYLAGALAQPPGNPGWTNIGSYLPECKLPFRPGWPYGSSADLVKWAAAFQRGAASKKPDPAQAAAIVLDHLKVCEPVLAELRAASLRRYCRFDLPYEEWANQTKTNVAERTLAHLNAIRGLYKVLSLRAEAELAAGQSDQALEDVNLMFRLDDGVKDEPLLICQLVCYASTTLLLHPIAQGLAERRWSEAQLHALQDRLERTDLLASTVRALYGERDICANPFFNSPIMKLRGWDRLEQVNFNRAFQEILLPRINLAGREINPAVSQACDLATNQYPRSGAWLHHCSMAAMMVFNVMQTVRRTAAVQTDVDLVTVACALERHRLAEGSYPDKLEALSPRFITTLPHDIINGQPLKYRRAPNGKFVLYSVGWNATDDGGVTATKQDGSPDRWQGDWVLQYPD